MNIIQYHEKIFSSGNVLLLTLSFSLVLVYDRNHYFGFGPIPKPKPKLADTFGRYRNRYRNQKIPKLPIQIRKKCGAFFPKNVSELKFRIKHFRVLNYFEKIFLISSFAAKDKIDGKQNKKKLCHVEMRNPNLNSVVH